MASSAQRDFRSTLASSSSHLGAAGLHAEIASLESRLRAAERAIDKAAALETELAALQARLQTAERASHKANLDLRRREWMLQTMDAMRMLHPDYAAIDAVEGISSQEFLDQYYCLHRPVVLQGEMKEWPALNWTPDRMRSVIGQAEIEYQGDRKANAHFEPQSQSHKRLAPFDQFIDLITQPGAGNDAYMTANNSHRNREALRPLQADLGFLDKFLTKDAEHPEGMMWIGPAGTLTPMHHDLTNNLIMQVVGRKRLLVCPYSETPKLANDLHVFSAVRDLEDPDLDTSRFPDLGSLRLYVIDLEPGDVLFMPVGWWHQVRALDFSVTITFTNFHWLNDTYKKYPSA